MSRTVDVLSKIPQKTSTQKQIFTFADLFAGIGGMRIAFEKAGGICVLTSEIDDAALTTYRYNFPNNSVDHRYVNDVVELGNMKPDRIPSHDVLVAGFPCQPYSIAGLRQGLDDDKGRGAVFHSLLQVLRKKKPQAFLLENVKGMISHAGGSTVQFMIQELAKTGYSVMEPQVLNSMIHGGVPQNRERVFIVGFRKDLSIPHDEFQWPKPSANIPSFRQLLETDVDEKYFYTAEKYDCFDEIKDAVRRDDTVYQWRRVYVRENKSGVCPALTANMGSGGHNVPLIRDGRRIRKLTPRECANLQGFKKSFKFPPGMADAHLYHQFGNSVTIPLIAKLALQIRKQLESVNSRR